MIVVVINENRSFYHMLGYLNLFESVRLRRHSARRPANGPALWLQQHANSGVEPFSFSSPQRGRQALRELRTCTERMGSPRLVNSTAMPKNAVICLSLRPGRVRYKTVKCPAEDCLAIAGLCLSIEGCDSLFRIGSWIAYSDDVGRALRLMSATDSGRNSFKGPAYHPARWPHTPVDFTGKRLGIIGTAASAPPTTRPGWKLSLATAGCQSNGPRRECARRIMSGPGSVAWQRPTPMASISSSRAWSRGLPFALPCRNTRPRTQITGSWRISAAASDRAGSHPSRRRRQAPTSRSAARPALPG